MSSLSGALSKKITSPICGGTKIADELSIPFLGSIPIDQKICEDADKGMPFIVEHANSPASKAFLEIVEKIEHFLERKQQSERIV